MPPASRTTKRQNRSAPRSVSRDENLFLQGGNGVAKDGLAIVRVGIDSLCCDPKNPRRHDEHNLETIKSSLNRFGQVEPLVVQKGTGMVIGGNGRLVAMQELGWSECDIVEIDMDASQAAILGITLNKTGLTSSWDDLVLIDQIDLMPLETVKSLGWTEEEIKALRFSLSPPTEEETPPKEPLPKEPKTCPNCGHLLST